MIKNIELDLVERNLKFKRKVMQELESIEIGEILPKFPILFLTCMDPRIDINKIFQFNQGDVFILRNAGNLYTLDVLRSIILTIAKFNIKYIVVLGHLDCGMTKIKLKKLKEKLPTKFLLNLSKNYYDYIPKLRDFFKPFIDELENIKKQIISLQVIKEFYPETEITGMLYDVKTGLVFEYEKIKDYVDIKSFTQDYNEIIVDKKDQFTDFLEVINTEEISNDESNDFIQDSELSEEKNPSISQNNARFMKKSVIELNKIKEKQKNDILTIIPKISIPKIQFHGVKIHIPKISTNKKKFQVFLRINKNVKN